MVWVAENRSGAVVGLQDNNWRGGGAIEDFGDGVLNSGSGKLELFEVVISVFKRFAS